MRCPFAVAVLLCAVLPLPGCILVGVAAVAAAGAGAISYENNEAWMDFHQDLAKVWDNAQKAAAAVGFAVQGVPALGASEGSFDAGDAHVVVEKHAGDYVRVRVRVGTFDTKENERKAKLVLEELKKLLPS